MVLKQNKGKYKVKYLWLYLMVIWSLLIKMQKYVIIY